MKLTRPSLIMLVLLSLCLLCLVDGACRVARDKETGTSVSCSHSELTSFPTLFSSNITLLDVSFNKLTVIRHNSLSDDGSSHLRHLDVSHNSVHQLDVRALWGLHELQTLDLSHNQLSVLSNQTLVKLSLLKTLKLDHNQLSSLDPSVFRGLSNLLHLDLRHNNVRDLQKDAFSQLGRLQWLAIGFNRLERLESGAMAGLSALIYLDLSSNKLHLTSSVYPAGVFRSLGQLQNLHLESNDNREFGQYPDGVFTDLVSLQLLDIDTFTETHFGPDFAKLRNIQTLSLRNNCKIGILTNDSLLGFKNSTLSFLSLETCPLLEMEPCVFCYLPALKRLYVAVSPWSPPNRVLEALYGLQHQAMSEIMLDQVGHHLPFTHVIDKHSARYLRNICLSSLSMTDSNIQRITGASLAVSGTPFLQCLKHIDLSLNSIIGDVSTLLKLLSSNGPLETFSIQDQRTFSITDTECWISKDFRCKDNVRLYNNKRDHEYTVIIPTPPNITHLNISGCFPHLIRLPYNLTFSSAVHLKALDFSYLGMRNCYFTLYGLPSLETLNLKGNYCYNITETMFDFLPSLKSLGLPNLGISPHFFLSRGRRLLQKLDGLEKLDLSANSLKHADPEMLSRQRQMKELDLSGNRFMAVPVNVDDLGQLNVFDLSSNSLTTLTSQERTSLDKLAIRRIFKRLRTSGFVDFLVLRPGKSSTLIIGAAWTGLGFVNYSSID